jgi:glycoside hydrolase-like protein
MGSHRSFHGRPGPRPGGSPHAKRLHTIRRVLGPSRGRHRAPAVATLLALGAGLAVTTVIAHGARSTTPPDWRSVTYQGVSLRVPPTWPVTNLSTHPQACPRLDRHALYLGAPGPHPACPAKGLHAKTDVAQLAATVPGSPQTLAATKKVTIGGVPAMTNPGAAVGHTIIVVFPTAGATLSLSYGTSDALVRQVEASVRVVSTAHRAAARAPTATQPAAVAQGVVTGRGFDTCSTPSLSTMNGWHSSPYRSIGVYIGGADMACAQPALRASWVSTVEHQGWHVFPLYPGPQAPCVTAPGNVTFGSGNAASAGTAAASDAAAAARNLGFPSGTPVIYDMEAYSGCGSAVVQFINAWDRRLQSMGFTSGVYESTMNLGDLTGARGRITEPTVLYYANWDGHATTSSPYVPSGMWTSHQRIHQYLGNTFQTFGGVTLGIDEDWLNVNLGSHPPFTDHPTRPQTALVDHSGTVHVYDKASTSRLWEDHLPPGSGWAWKNLSGKWPTNPAAVEGSDGTVRLYARGQNGHLYEKHLPPGGTWSTWFDMGGNWPFSPGALAAPNDRIRVFAVGTGGKLWERHLPTGQGWSAWQSLGDKSLGGMPAATVGSAGVVRVYVRATTHTLREASLVSGKPWAWHNLKGDWPYDPAVVTDPAGTVRVYEVGTDGHLYEDQLPAGGTWTGWRSRGGTSLIGIPAVAVDKQGTIRVYVRTKYNYLKEAYLAHGGAWTWDKMGGPWHTDASAVVDPDGIVRVYEAGKGGAMNEKHLSPGATWSGWWDMGGP